MGISDKKRRKRLLEILLMYESTNYKETVLNLRNHLSNYPNDNDALFYYGVSLLEIGNHTETVDQFIALLKRDTAWNKEAAWYLALSKLKMKKDRHNSIHKFQEIAKDENSPYQEKAINLLKSLNQ